jgi:hypothetical protein
VRYCEVEKESEKDRYIYIYRERERGRKSAIGTRDKRDIQLNKEEIVESRRCK